MTSARRTSGLGQDLVEAGEARVAAQILDEEEAPAPEGPESQLEQPLGELSVRALQAPLGRGRQPFALPEVDGDVPARGQLRDPLDGGLERVRERETRDRLTHDGKDRLRAPQGESDELGAPGPAESHRRAGREARQEVGLRLGCSFREDQLERPGRRLTERDDDRVLDARDPGFAPTGFERGLNALRRPVERARIALEAVCGEERRGNVSFHAPEEDEAGAARLGRQADDLLGELALVGSCGKRVADQLEREARALGLGRGAPDPVDKLERNPDLSCREPRERPFARGEALRVAVKLEGRNGPVFARDGQDECDVGRGEPAGPADRPGRGLVLDRRVLDLLGPDLGRCKARAFELRGQHRARLDGHRHEAAGVRRQDARQRDLGAHCLRRSADDLGQRVVEGGTAEDRPDRGGDCLEGGGLLCPVLDVQQHTRIIASGCAIRRKREESGPMPAPAPRRTKLRAVPYPPSPLQRAMIRERAKRRAKIEHEREKKRARRRFQVLLLALLFLTIVLGLTIWDQIQALFGL